MAAQVSKSILFASLGAEAMTKAHEENKAKPPEVGQAPRLPAGIENGIAELKECGFSLIKADAKKNAGKPQFHCMAVVKEPVQFTDSKGNVYNVRNMQTRIFIPLVDVPANTTYNTTAKSAADKFKEAQDWLKMLGGEVTQRQIASLTPAQLQANPTFFEDLAKSLAVRKDKDGNRIHIYFRTWKREGKDTLREIGGKWVLGTEDDNGNWTESDPRKSWPTEEAARKANKYLGREGLVNEVWYSTCKAPVATPSDLVDETPEDPAANQPKVNGQAKAATTSTKPAAKSAVAAIPPTKPPVVEEQEPEGDPNADADGGLTELAMMADDEDAPSQEARERIEQAAYADGITESEMKAAKNYLEIVDWIVQGLRPSEEDVAVANAEQQEPVEEVQAPAKVGEIVGHFPIDARTKQPMTKPVKAEVQFIDAEAQTFDLVNVTKRSIVYKAVPWDAVKV